MWTFDFIQSTEHVTRSFGGQNIESLGILSRKQVRSQADGEENGQAQCDAQRDDQRLKTRRQFHR